MKKNRITRFILAALAFLLTVVPVWAMVEFKKGEPGMIREENPHALDQAKRVVASNNAVLALAEKKELQVNKPSNSEEKLQFQKWINSVVQENTKSDEQLIRRALELAYEKVPKRVKEWMSYVHEIDITDLWGAFRGTNSPELGLILVDRNYLSHHKVWSHEAISPELQLLQTIVHEARHIWQRKSMLTDQITSKEDSFLDYHLRLWREKDAIRATYQFMKELNFPEEIIGLQKWLADNIGIGNKLVDKYALGDVTEKEKRKVWNQLKKIRTQLATQKKNGMK